jgi:triphosphoribosyl-dephospho-CoA synthase
MSPRLTAGECAQLACMLEATARKPGNVHRAANFEDCSYLDFLLSAQAIAAPMDRARERGVGVAVLESVRATRRLTRSNTNLGMILLLAPLAVAFEREPLREELTAVLEGLTLDDARHVYEAVRLAEPGGLGTASEQDVAEEPTVTLAEAMRLGAARDVVARQYINGYTEVFEHILPRLCEGLLNGWPLETAIIWTFLKFLAANPDTLIVRKRGADVANHVSSLAERVLQIGWPDTAEGRRSLRDLDRWLRGEGHARNPGATADLVAAGLFVALADGTISLPIDRFDMEEL